MKACGTPACNQGRGAPCSAGCDDVLSAQAEGARMCGAWPYTGTPSIPGPLTEAELDQRNAEMRVRLRHATSLAEMQDRYIRGMRALSKEEMEQHYLEQARGMMNVYPQAFYGNATQAAMNNAAPSVEPELDGPYRKTWRQKLRAFWDAVRWG